MRRGLKAFVEETVSLAETLPFLEFFLFRFRWFLLFYFDTIVVSRSKTCIVAFFLLRQIWYFVQMNLYPRLKINEQKLLLNCLKREANELLGNPRFNRKTSVFVGAKRQLFARFPEIILSTSAFQFSSVAPFSGACQLNESNMPAH